MGTTGSFISHLGGMAVVFNVHLVWVPVVVDQSEGKPISLDGDTVVRKVNRGLG